MEGASRATGQDFQFFRMEFLPFLIPATSHPVLRLFVHRELRFPLILLLNQTQLKSTIVARGQDLRIIVNITIRNFGGDFQFDLHILHMVTLDLRGKVIHTSKYRIRTEPEL